MEKAPILPLSKAKSVTDSNMYTNRELFEAIKVVEKDVASGMQSVDRALHAIDLRLTKTESLIAESLAKRAEDHETRLRTLEMWVYRIFIPVDVIVLAVVVEIIRRALS